MDKVTKCYSNNNEDYESNLDTVADSAFDYTDAKVGDVATVWEADAKYPKASSFFPDLDWILEGMSESAGEVYGEHAYDWLSTTTPDGGLQLANMLHEAVDRWAEDTKNEPDFYHVTGDHEIQIRLLDGSWEVVDNG